MSAAAADASDVCASCLEAVAPTAAAWSCASCAALLHLPCAQRHAAASLSAAAPQQLRAARTWSCPACARRLSEAEYPRAYLCFCGKTREPAFDERELLAPHSCDAPCARPRALCAHACVQRCHRGPCAPCAVPVTTPCWCGKAAPVKRCGQSASTCGLPCGRTGAARGGAAAAGCAHPCGAQCHQGACGPCIFPVVGARCRCGKAARTLPCFRRDFSCGAVCGRALDCRRHACARECHSGECEPCAPAAASAAGGRACPCGKRAYPGLACDEPAPSCGDTCGRAMACGAHSCARRCHEGACGECDAVTEGPCRCGRSRGLRGLCRDGQLLCERRCTLPRNCDRHACKRKCCAGDCQTCIEVCGRALACGHCSCGALCHKECGPCPRTRSVACACGGTTLDVPCGREREVRAPICSLRCRAAPDCLHAARSPHPCHAGDCPPCDLPCGLVRARCGHACAAPCHSPRAAAAVSGAASAPAPKCPPCTEPVRRQCVGGHGEIEVPCSAPALFACASPCGRLLPCGKHRCERACHGGPCADACTRPCEELRPERCTHACGRAAACHSGSCPPCNAVIRRRCHCGAASTALSCEEERARVRAGAGDAAAPLGTAGAEPLTAAFSCGARCMRQRSCGHLCSKSCHAGDCATEPCAKGGTARCPCGARKESWACDRVIARRAELGTGGAGAVRTTFELLECDSSEGSACRAAADLAEAVAAAAAGAAAAAAAVAADGGEESGGGGASAMPRDPELKKRRADEARKRRADEAAAAQHAHAEREAAKEAAKRAASAAAAAASAAAAAAVALDARRSAERMRTAVYVCTVMCVVGAGALMFVAFFA